MAKIDHPTERRERALAAMYDRVPLDDLRSFAAWALEKHNGDRACVNDLVTEAYLSVLYSDSPCTEDIEKVAYSGDETEARKMTNAITISSAFYYRRRGNLKYGELDASKKIEIDGHGKEWDEVDIRDEDVTADKDITSSNPSVSSPSVVDVVRSCVDRVMPKTSSGFYKKTLFEMYYISGYSLGDIASETGINFKTAHSSVNDVAWKVKDVIEEEFERYGYEDPYEAIASAKERVPTLGELRGPNKKAFTKKKKGRKG